MKISQRVSGAIEGLLFPYSGFSKGHNSVKTVGSYGPFSLHIV